MRVVSRPGRHSGVCSHLCLFNSYRCGIYRLYLRTYAHAKICMCHNWMTTMIDVSRIHPSMDISVNGQNKTTRRARGNARLQQSINNARLCGEQSMCIRRDARVPPSAHTTCSDSYEINLCRMTRARSAKNPGMDSSRFPPHASLNDYVVSVLLRCDFRERR